MSKIIRRIVQVLIALIVIAQFFQIDKTNPDYDASKDFITMVNAPEDIGHMLKVTCYDCHAYETKYPWYTNIAPLSWWIKHHIDEGRDELNFSIWTTYEVKRKVHKMEEAAEEVDEGGMPLDSYTWAHPEAQLTLRQRQELVAFFKAQEIKEGQGLKGD